MVIKITDKFINREKELEVLKDRLNSDQFELIIIYGRRRIGKTSLVLKAIENKKHIYYLATESDNLRKFKEMASRTVESLRRLKDDWLIIFEELSKKDKLIVVIDEFPYLIKEDSTIVSTFQYIVDETLQNTNIKLILLGSSISMMINDVLAYRSPLYGRRTSSMKIKKLKFKDFCKFFENKEIIELIETFGFSDGIPYYIRKIDKSRNFWDWLQEEINKIDSFIKYEVDFILKTEFENLRMYKRILEAIAFGKTTRKEIKDFAHLQNIDISQYLYNLMETEFITRKKPVFGGIKDGRYYLSDNFLKFWFRYVYPNLSLIEEGVFNVNDIKKDYSNYLRDIFEEICLEFVLDHFDVAGKQLGNIPKKFREEYGNTYEIDIVAYDESKLVFGECKWKDNVDAKKICKDLVDKIQFVEIHTELKDHKKELWLFARSFKEKITEFEGYEVKCFDLKYLEKLIVE